MSQTLTNWQDFPASPQVATYPDAIYSYVTVAVAGSYLIKPDNDLQAQTAWQIGNRDRLSWGFKLSPTAHRGGTLLIHVFYNAEGNTALSQNIWRSYRLSAQGVVAGIPQNWMTGLKLPHLYCYFEIVAMEANLVVDGFLKLEAS